MGRGRSRRREGSGGKFKQKGKKEEMEGERRGRCDGEQKRLGSPCVWTMDPARNKQNAWLLHPVLWLSFQPVNANTFLDPWEVADPRQGTTLPALTFPSLSIPSFHLYPFCTSLVFMLPSQHSLQPPCFSSAEQNHIFSYRFALSRASVQNKQGTQSSFCWAAMGLDEWAKWMPEAIEGLTAAHVYLHDDADGCS